MGIIISIPQLGGSLSILPQTSTIYPTSPVPTLFYHSKSGASSVSSVGLHQSNIKSTVAIISATQAEKSQPAGVTTKLTSVHVSEFSACTDTITTLFSTATVTSTTTSSHSIIVTATIPASNCSVSVNASSIKTQSAQSSILSTMRATTSSGPAAASSNLRFSTIPSRTSSYRGSSRAVSSQRSLSKRTTDSEMALSGVMLPRLQAYNLSSLNRNVSGVGSNHMSPQSGRVPVPTVFIGTTNSVGGHDNAHGGLDYASSSSAALAKITHSRIVTVKGPPHIPTTSNSCGRSPHTTTTELTHLTTTTIYKSTIVNHTSTTTITTLPSSCLATRTLTSTQTSPTTCTSATPNPKPPTNDTCAEDGLLEYASTVQSADTLEGCALACLTDTTCLSFTFIPSESTCSTSLYPLADSSFAGVQPYHIYNYDRDCYLCSS